VNGNIIKSDIISCSWGVSENLFPSNYINILESLFQQANTAGIPICVASGTNNGISDDGVDYPSSSPHVISCGGTSLRCPNLKYDSETTETATNGGGGYSKLFQMPAWQTALKSTQPVLQNTTMRALPDVAMNADPNTGVHMLIGGNVFVVGGTSIVAPAMAALIGCMDIPAFSAAKLYSAFSSDINSGFNVVKEYDCETGLGSPNGVALAAKSAH